MKRKGLILAALMLGVTSLIGCSSDQTTNSTTVQQTTANSASNADLSQDVVAVINGVEIPESLYRTYLWSAQSFFEMQMGTDIGTIMDIEIEGQTIASLAKERALDSVLLAVVVTDVADSIGANLTDDEQALIAQQAADFMAINGEIANTYLFTQDDVEKLLIGAELSTKVQEKLGESYMPSEEEIVENVEAARSSYELVTARHILISTLDDFGQVLDDEAKAEKEALAQELLDRVKSGEDIGQLAAEYSEDPGSALANGEYTFYRGEMVAPFEEAAFGSNEGEIWPELVESTFGYHIGQTIVHIAADDNQIREEYIAFARIIFAEQELMDLMDSAVVEKTDAFEDVYIITREEPLQ
ncbi:MAG: hypothetical protein ATN35_01140 [Epulopiscium sp. Nele67-Bin004]|nr:MAG: hypothetical protein ATN35_01140 [Epulopiscium sp. Nele67-Bin004]